MIGPIRQPILCFGKCRLRRRGLPDLSSLLTGLEHVVRRRADGAFDHVFTAPVESKPYTVEIDRIWDRGGQRDN